MAVIQAIVEVIACAQTEICIFMLSICVHALVFGKYNLFSKGKKGLEQCKAGGGKKTARGGSSSKPSSAKSEAFVTASAASPLVALQAALTDSDLEAAIGHVKTLAEPFRASLEGSPSQAPQRLLQQLIRLALTKGQLPKLAQELCAFGLFSKQMVEWMLSECAQRSDGAALKASVNLARAQGVALTERGYSVLIKGTGNLAESERLFKEAVKAGLGGASLYNAMIDVAGGSCNLKAAERVMAEALEKKLADVVTYNTIIKARLRHHDLRGAHADVAAMRAAGLTPNLITFHELLNASVANGTGTMWKILDEMKASGLQHNLITCSIFLKSIQQASPSGDLEKVLALMDTAEGSMDEVLLSSLCEACIRASRNDLLGSQLRKYRGTNKRVQVKCPHTFGSLIRAYGYIGDLQGLRDAWREMKMRDIVPTSITIGCMVEATVSNDSPEAGWELIHELQATAQTRPLVNTVIYCSVLKGFSHQKRFQQVWAVYQEMISEKIEFSLSTYNLLIDACARKGDMGCVHSLLEEMASKDLAPNIMTYGAILKGYCQASQFDNAYALYEDMKRHPGVKPDEVTYNTLLDGCARQGLYDKGMQVLQEMQESGVRPSNFTLTVLAKLATRSKKYAKAFELVEELAKQYRLKPNVHVYGNLMQAAAQLEDSEKILRVMEDMLRSHVRPDARTYTMALRGCLQAGAVQDAAGLLRAACGLRGAHPRLVSFGTSLLRPCAGTCLTTELLTEVLESIWSQSGDARLASHLLNDLSRQTDVRLDPKLKACLNAAGKQ